MTLCGRATNGKADVLPDARRREEQDEGRETYTMAELLLKLKTFWNREEGQGLVEYALILVLVSIVAIGALAAIGTSVTSVLQSIADTLNNALG
jgi:pilus assembly protein Flp/PilA